MKIKIVFEFKDISGGGNQFLRALKEYFSSKGVYEENIEQADIVLFNSHHELEKIISLKRRFPKKIFIHRVDGPVSLIRGKDLGVDSLIFEANELLADGTIFQSKWSKSACKQAGLKENNFEATIINAPNENIFNKKGKQKYSKTKKLRIIATSWSDNWNKGFEDYRWLDEKLNFERYEMIFVGNLPKGLIFENIKHLKPLDSRHLAVELRSSDVFITASRKDPCSNSLIEALHCSLPAIGLHDGGHPEIIKKGGVTYSTVTEIPNLLKNIKESYEKYQNLIEVKNMNETGDRYQAFIENIFEEISSIKHSVKRIDSLGLLRLRLAMIVQRIKKHF